MAGPDLNHQLHRSKLGQYLLADEVEILAQRQHWVVLAEPIGSAVAGFLVVLTVDIFLPATIGGLADVFWWAWFALVVRACSKWFMWRRKWLVATDKRLLLNYGLIHQGVAMLSLSRVVDLTYTRSTLGQLLNYGSLVRESSGHLQTLHEIKWVRNPHSTYLTICAAVFGIEDRERGTVENVHDHRFEDGPPRHAPGLYAEYVPLEKRPGPTEFPGTSGASGASNTADDSSGLQIRYGLSRKADRESWYLSPDLREPAARGADTGSIPYRRPATDAGDDWTPTTDEDGFDNDNDGDNDHDSNDSNDDGGEDD